MDPRKSISRKPKTEDLTTSFLSVLFNLKHLLLPRPVDIKLFSKNNLWIPEKVYHENRKLKI